MFEGDSADTVARKFSGHVNGGLSKGARVRRPGSEDPHRHERKFSPDLKIHSKVVLCNLKTQLRLQEKDNQVIFLETNNT